MGEPIQQPEEENYSWFWTIFIIVAANVIITTVLFIDLAYIWLVLGALAFLDLLLVVLLVIGAKRHEKVKDKDISATTFSRKMFNIISGLLFAVLIFVFKPFVALFILFGVDFAFGFHELVYVQLKTRMYFTKAFIALGRQSEPFKPYLASIMALLGFTIALGFQTFMFQYFSIPQYEFSVAMVYMATVLIWGIGDTAAYFAGTRLGKHHLPYNKKKTWEGFCANMGVGIAIGLIFFSPLVLSFITPFWWILIALLGGVGGAVFESVNLHLDDNFVSAALMGLLLGLLTIAATL
ncbi:MAG: phosphatidate cytidylyltransferase [Candidatus Helarchaeota archaeon]|nr:phosphatidate cytidylyltransferase [Candidatus Helarchaeota archaeon]